MAMILAIVLVMSFIMSMAPDYKYVGAIIFSITLLCTTLLLITNKIN